MTGIRTPIGSQLTTQLVDSLRVDVAPGTVLRFRYLSERLGWLDDDAAEQRWPNEHGTFDNIVYVPLHVEETP